jgi:TRAP-type mannitol/chloroaromatic compound transport system permease small subunit
MRLMKSWRNSFLHHVSLYLIFATTMEKQVMSDIPAVFFFFFPFSLSLLFLFTWRDPKMKRGVLEGG